jgi:penicillin-binding protein 1A
MSFLGGIFSMLTLGLAGGAVAAGAVIYIYGRDLPSYEALAQYTPQTISRVYDGDGAIIDEFATERRLFTPVEDIPDLVKHAFVSAEDQNFYTHPGFDLRGMAAAFVQAVRTRGEELRGASTITQQVMKNFLLSADRTAERKIKEIILAVRIEQAMDKEGILELYLNEIFLGANSYGVTAAAQSYFNKPLDELSPGEAAYLAALAQRPGSLHPVEEAEDAFDRRNYVLGRMAEDGYITEAVAEGREGPAAPHRAGRPDRGIPSDPPAPRLLHRRDQAPVVGQLRRGGVLLGRLVDRATMDPELQVVAAHALSAPWRGPRRRRGWHGTGRELPPEALATRRLAEALAEPTRRAT